MSTELQIEKHINPHLAGIPKFISLSSKRTETREFSAVVSREHRKSEMTGDTIALSRKSRGLSMYFQLTSKKKEVFIKVENRTYNMLTTDFNVAKDTSFKKVANVLGTFKPVSGCQQIMRRFTDANRVQCHAMDEEMDEPTCSIGFPTGSTYCGPWNVRGMTGHGTYEFPGGKIIYEGNFEDGQFHGDGDLIYLESGVRLKAKWSHGIVTERTLIFKDGLEYDEDHTWRYCEYPDRRFTKEYDEGIEPASRTLLTAEQPTIDVPEGYYDTGEGFFDPSSGMNFKYDDITAIIRNPSQKEAKWIVDNCRAGKEEPVGPCPFFYEECLEPQLKRTDPPEPAARTKTFVGKTYDDMWRDYEEDEQRWQRLRFSRMSRQSRISRVGLFMSSRSASVASGRASVASGRASVASGHASVDPSQFRAMSDEFAPIPANY